MSILNLVLARGVETVPDDSVAPADDDRPVILTDVTERIGTITLNRPDRRNALNGALMSALDAAVGANGRR